MQGFRELISLHVATETDRQAGLRQERLRQAIANIDELLAEAKAALEAAETRVSDLQSNRKELEGEVETIQSLRSKYGTQLLEAKTNEVYRTLLSEIETAKAKIYTHETSILDIIEEAEAAEEGVVTAKAALAEAQAHADQEAKRFQSELQELDGKRETAKAQCVELRNQVPKPLLAQFERIAGMRDGKAMALVEKGVSLVAEQSDIPTCTDCHVAIRPQVWVDIHKGNQFYDCPGCGRLLYNRDNLNSIGLEEPSIIGSGPAPGDAAAPAPPSASADPQPATAEG